MRFLIAIVLVALTCSPVHGSMPSGRKYGSWTVSSIRSLDGVHDGDGAVHLYQKANCQSNGNCDELHISSSQDSNSIGVYIYINDCYGENQDFDQGYTINRERWFESGRKISQRIDQDFRTWIEQVKLVCARPERFAAFRFQQITPAVRDFSNRLAALN